MYDNYYITVLYIYTILFSLVYLSAIVHIYTYIHIIFEIPTHVSLAPEGINIKKTHYKGARMKRSYTYYKKGEKINVPATLQRVPYY